MGETRGQRNRRRLVDAGTVWRVVDGLSPAPSVSDAELDAVEAFLMRQLDAILSHVSGGAPRATASRASDSDEPQMSAPTNAQQG